MTLEKELGPLQMRILGLLEAGPGQSVADMQKLLEQGGHRAAYTTVMTVLARLHERGLVRRERDGKRHVYHPARRAGRTKHRILQRVHRALFQSERLEPIARLVDSELTAAELKQLRALIDEKLGEPDAG